MRILAYLNVSFAGIFAFSRTVMVGEASDLRLLDLNECVRVARENRDLIVGIKVRVGRGAGGSSGVAPLDMALEVAEELDLPVMAHIDHPPPSPQGSAGAAAPRRRAHPLLPAVSQLAAARRRRPCARKRCSRASAA